MKLAYNVLNNRRFPAEYLSNKIFLCLEDDTPLKGHLVTIKTRGNRRHLKEYVPKNSNYEATLPFLPIQYNQMLRAQILTPEIFPEYFL